MQNHQPVTRKDCPEPGCDWRNDYQSCSDGSREYARHVHLTTAHPEEGTS